MLKGSSVPLFQHRSNITFPDVSFEVMADGFGPYDVDLEYEFGFLKLEDYSTAEVGGPECAV